VQSVWGARTILEKWREAKNDRLGSNLKENENPKPQTQNLPDTPLRNLRQKAQQGVILVRLKYLFVVRVLLFDRTPHEDL
jgi:hypothetical protein